MLLVQIILGVVFITTTVIIHAVILNELMSFIKKIAPSIHKKTGRSWRVIVLSITVLGVFCSQTIHVWLWSSFYLYVGAFAFLEEALYFSVTTFSTVGYGDIIIAEQWRLIAGLESANGFMLFGWSTAFIFEVMSRLYETTPLEKGK